MNLLHIDSSILGDNSVSRAISAAVVARLRSAGPSVEVTYRDLAAAPLTHLSGSYLAGQPADVQHDQALQEDLTLGGTVLAEFLAAETIVLGVPLYNFAIPSQLKAWVDRICVAGKTFRYTESGAVGLAGGKRVILAIARGGLYGPGSPHAAAEHGESYLRIIFGFLGIGDVEAVRAEGIALGPERRSKALESAKRDAAALLVA